MEKRLEKLSTDVGCSPPEPRAVQVWVPIAKGWHPTQHQKPSRDHRMS